MKDYELRVIMEQNKQIINLFQQLVTLAAERREQGENKTFTDEFLEK